MSNAQFKKGAAAFFAYARARHQIYLDRAAGKPYPWTKDPILGEYSFCNVFRELDRNTIWYRQNVRERYDGTPTVLLGTVLFRMINRIETCDVIFNQSDRGTTTFDRLAQTRNMKEIRAALSAMEKLIYKEIGTTGPFVTGAYTLSSPPGFKKLPGVLEIVRRFMEQSEWRTAASELMAKSHPSWYLEKCWEWLRMFDFFGDFHAYEIVTDLRHTYLLREAPDIMTWANPGPGANRGANRIHGRELEQRNSKAQLNEEMRELLALSRETKFWPYNEFWEMRDVEHTLCEFDKYTRVQLGQGRPRSKYKYRQVVIT
jgi:hypothetical protein